MTNKHTILGDSIKAWRQFYSWSQAELGEKLGVSGKTVSSWEIGRTEPNMGMLATLARFFKCSIKELITGEDPEDVTDKDFFEDYDRQIIAESMKNLRNNGEDLYCLFKEIMNATPKDLATLRFIYKTLTSETDEDLNKAKAFYENQEARIKMAEMQSVDENYEDLLLEEEEEDTDETRLSAKKRKT